MKRKTINPFLLGCLCAGIFVTVIAILPSFFPPTESFLFLQDHKPIFACGQVHDSWFIKSRDKYLEFYSFATDVRSFDASVRNELIPKGYQAKSADQGNFIYFKGKSVSSDYPLINVYKNFIVVEDTNRPLGEQAVKEKKDGYITIEIEYPRSRELPVKAAIEGIKRVRHIFR